MIRFAHQDHRNAPFAAFPHDLMQGADGSAGAVPHDQALPAALLLDLRRHAVAAQQDHAAFCVLHPIYGDDPFLTQGVDCVGIMD